MTESGFQPIEVVGNGYPAPGGALGRAERSLLPGQICGFVAHHLGTQTGCWNIVVRRAFGFRKGLRKVLCVDPLAWISTSMGDSPLRMP